MSDKRLEWAVMHLWNRDEITEKVFRNDRTKYFSYWPLSEYISPIELSTIMTLKSCSVTRRNGLY